MAGGEDEPTDEEAETPLEQIVSGAVTALTLLVAFGLMFAGYGFFWVAFVVGFGGVLPMALGAVKLYQRRQDDLGAGGGADGTDETADALETLRERYARGELTEAEFERRVEKLVGTESVDDARAYVRAGRDAQTASGRDAQTASDRDEETTLDRDEETTHDSGERASVDGDADSEVHPDRARELDREPE